VPKILVTGAAGKVGQAFIGRLLASGEDRFAGFTVRALCHNRILEAGPRLEVMTSWACLDGPSFPPPGRTPRRPQRPLPAVRNLEEFRSPGAGIRSSGWKQALQAFTIYFDGRIPTP